MSDGSKQLNPGKILLTIGLLLSISAFGYRVYSNYYQMPIDYLIFLKTARDFQDTGKLYQRGENYTEKYSPSAAIYKFPPPFQIAFVPLAKLPRGINQLQFIKPLLIGMYILSVLLLYQQITKTLLLSSEQQFYFGTLLAITACWFMPFFESLRWLLAEIPILLIFVAGFIAERKGKIASFFSGVATAFITCIKIYPAFMAGNLLREKNHPAMAGFFIGGITTLCASIYIFGLAEHIFYAKHILPVLLNEEVTPKWINLNFEKFLFSAGLISEVNGRVFNITRLAIISIFLSLLVRHHRCLLNNPFLAFSFFICTMFFCFPNYWPQYQLYLIIPFAYLLASQLKNCQSTSWTVLLVITVTVLFIPDNLWRNPLLVQIPLASPVFLLLYEARSLATIALWFLIVREIHMLTNLPIRK